MRREKKAASARIALRTGRRLLPVFFAAAWGAAVLLGGPETAYGAEIQKEEDRAVYDYAGLFDEEQTQRLEEEAARVIQDAGFDVVVMTASDTEGSESQAYADYAYEAGGFGLGRDHSGILYLIDMDNRELTFSTTGAAIRVFTDRRIETMLDHVYEYASDGEYAGSAESFLEDVRSYAAQGVVSGQYNYDTETGAVSVHRSIRWYEVLLAAAVSAVAAGGAAVTVRNQYKMETNERQNANYNMAYRADSQFEFADKRDLPVGTFVTTSLIAAGAAMAAAGGSGHRGGGPGPRASSTHHSAGGHVHGGGSRRF